MVLRWERPMVLRWERPMVLRWASQRARRSGGSKVRRQASQRARRSGGPKVRQQVHPRCPYEPAARVSAQTRLSPPPDQSPPSQPTQHHPRPPAPANRTAACPPTSVGAGGPVSSTLTHLARRECRLASRSDREESWTRSGIAGFERGSLLGLLGRSRTAVWFMPHGRSTADYGRLRGG
jgi:hypothetical protein